MSPVALVGEIANGVFGVCKAISEAEAAAALRRFIVTLLEDRGIGGRSAGAVCLSGVLGTAGAADVAGVVGTAGSVSTFIVGSCARTSPSTVVELEMSWEVSMDLAGDPDCEVRRRFREVKSLSSNGLGLVVLGSEETARSRKFFGSLGAWESMGMDGGGGDRETGRGAPAKMDRDATRLVLGCCCF
jgi:hypothetical protein